MARHLLPVLVLLVACGKPEPASVRDCLDALRVGELKDGNLNTVALLPGPREDREPAAPERFTLGAQLRKSEHGRAVLDGGEDAVPELVACLEETDRRTLAALFLAEIGGAMAARALLATWRDLREVVRTQSVYRENRGSATMHEGSHPSGFYGQLLFALSYAGRPVSAEVAADTREALATVERLRSKGVELTHKRREDSVEYRWNVEPVQTACEGLEVLAMVGAPEGGELFAAALRSPVRALQWTAVHNVGYLGAAARPALPALAELLDDPDWREEALGALREFYRDGILPDPETEAQWRARAAHWRERIKSPR